MRDDYHCILGFESSRVTISPLLPLSSPAPISVSFGIGLNWVGYWGVGRRVGPPPPPPPPAPGVVDWIMIDGIDGSTGAVSLKQKEEKEGKKERMNEIKRERGGHDPAFIDDNNFLFLISFCLSLFLFLNFFFFFDFYNEFIGSSPLLSGSNVSQIQNKTESSSIFKYSTTMYTQRRRTTMQAAMITRE